MSGGSSLVAAVTRTMEPSEVPELSNTAICGCCKVCGGPEKMDKRFLICGHSLCMYKYYHIRCLRPEQIACDSQLDKPYWYCPSCLCRVCLNDTDDDHIILCDGCDEGHHLHCLSPPRSSVPKGKWYCSSCIAAREKEGKMRKYEQRMLKLHRKDDGVMLKSGKYDGVDLLLSAAEELRAEESGVAVAK